MKTDNKKGTVVTVKGIDPLLKRRFQSALALQGMSMKEAISYYMEAVVRAGIDIYGKKVRGGKA